MVTPMIRRVLGRGPARSLARVPLADRLKISLTAFVALLLVVLISRNFADGAHWGVLVGSMGASAVLLYVLPNSPLAQPWSFTAGHLVPGFIGVCSAMLIDDMALAAATAVGLSILAMYLLECMHPPGGAASLVPVIAAQSAPAGFEFLLFPLSLNVLVMLVLAVLLNRYWLKRPYPARPLREEDPAHKHADPRPLRRLSVNSEDLRAALAQFDAFVDVSEQDLDRLYHLAEQIAHRRRLGEIRCADIMSRDLITVERHTDLDAAWRLLRHHRVRILPVVDGERRIVGVISVADFLKRADLKPYRSFREDLQRLLHRGPLRGRRGEPRRVGELMAGEVFTVEEGEHIAAVVPLLSDRGLHHVPVVDAAGRLSGMVTQSDLIAALYARAVEREPAAVPLAPFAFSGAAAPAVCAAVTEH